LVGYAFSMAAATMVGQSLGMNDPKRANAQRLPRLRRRRGVMGIMGVMFVLFSNALRQLPRRGPRDRRPDGQVPVHHRLRATRFAASMIFSAPCAARATP
jgi:hypothetical protein